MQPGFQSFYYPGPLLRSLKLNVAYFSSRLVFYLEEGTLGNVMERTEILEANATCKSWFLTWLIFETWSAFY